jgi:head-tail adaptor
VISAAELTAMRGDLTASMPSQVVIERVTLTSDGMGGQTEAWAPVGTVVARVSPRSVASGLDDIIGGQVLNQTPWMVTVPVGTSVTERDRVVYEAQTFEVIRTNAPRSFDTCVRLECMEVS